MFGGPFVNLVIAARAVYRGASPASGPRADADGARHRRRACPAAGTSECAPGDPASPASVAGLQAGDTFVSVDGVAATSWTEMADYVSQHPGETLDRDGRCADGEPVDLTAHARRRASGNAARRFGWHRDRRVTWACFRSRSACRAADSGFGVTADYSPARPTCVANLPQQLWHVSRAALGLEERSQESVMGLVGVGRVAGEVAGNTADGVTSARQGRPDAAALGGLNLALFVFNMIPLVPLDGGHIASALWQAIKNGGRRPATWHTRHPLTWRA